VVVFAFDRDWTVDVNPHPRHEAVPLEWVRHLAHETDHPVYAIGNQDLAEEAAIPGVVDIVGRHSDDWDEWLGGKQSNGRYEQFPLRRERLELIEDLHPEAEAYVVVDDLDLSDVSEWDHYHAWEFVPAVRQGDVDPDLPWVRGPVTDGGYPTEAGIVPTGASDLKTFLGDVPNARVYELTYSVDDGDRIRLLWNTSLHGKSAHRPSAVTAIHCVPLAPGEESFTVPIDDIEKLSVIDPPPELFTTETDTPAEEAQSLRRLAEADPRQIQISSILTLLDSGAEPPREDALRALEQVAEVRPEDCTPAIPILQSLLELEDLSTPERVLGILGQIAEESPGDVAPLMDVIVPYLDSGSSLAQARAARCVSGVADGDPADAVEAVPAVAPLAEDGGLGHPHAIYALSCVTREFPEEVKPVADVLSESICDDSLGDGVRLNATAALGRIVKEYPDLGIDIVDDVATLFDADTPKLRNNAIGLMADVASVHTDVVEPRAGAIAEFLTAEDGIARSNATGALARVAEDFSDTVARWTDQFIALLEDEEPLVRRNACWALGHLSADDAEMTLVERASQDENEAVRERAEWALHRIQR
jgi:hypothetical protein